MREGGPIATAVTVGSSGSLLASEAATDAAQLHVPVKLLVNTVPWGVDKVEKAMLSVLGQPDASMATILQPTNPTRFHLHSAPTVLKYACPCDSIVQIKKTQDVRTHFMSPKHIRGKFV